MSRLNYHMPIGIDQVELLLSIVTPKHKNNRAVFLIYLANDRICECFPSFALVRIWAVCTDSQHRIEHQDALFRPGNQVAVVGDTTANIIVQFDEDVHQRGWRPDAWSD